MPCTRFRVNLQSIVTLMNVKELLAQNERDIWSLSNNNGIRTHNHLVRKRLLNIGPELHLNVLVTTWQNISKDSKSPIFGLSWALLPTWFSCSKEYVSYSDDGFWNVIAEISVFNVNNCSLFSLTTPNIE